MSRDIRSFFNVLSKKTAPVKSDTSNGSNSNTKKRSITDLNTSDDIIPDTPENVKKSKKTSDKSQSKRRRIVALSSDSETENDSSKTSLKTPQKTSKTPQKVPSKPNLTNLRSAKEPQKLTSKKKVNPLDAFGSEPITQDLSKTRKSELDIHDDDDFNKTLMDLDEDELLNKAEEQTRNKTQSVSSDDSKSTPKTNEFKKEAPEIKKVTPTQDDSKNNIELPAKKATPSKNFNENKKKGNTPARKRKSNEDEDDPTGDPDQERFEKKRYSAMLYQKYLNRSGPANLGAKWIPKGKPDCLKNLCFIITGVLDSMQRDDAQALIVEHGGRCTQSVSGKVNYMVLGDDAGPSKVEKARKLGTKMISEDDLIDLICLKSGIENQGIKNKPISETNSSQKGTSSSTKTKKEEKPSKEKQKTPEKTSIKQEKTIRKIEQISDDDDDEIPSITVKEVKESVKIVPKTENSIKTASTTVKPKPSEKKIDVNSVAWVDKYKPTDIKQIIGQQGDKSNMNKLIKWLQNWYRNRESGGKGIQKPSPWAKDDSGAYFRAALLSGPPGVGKTTTATLVCKHLGFDTVEFNASDTRNQKMIHKEVSHIVNTTSLAGYVADGSAPTKKHALLMDEVDGMLGIEDRGGVGELMNLIKTSNIPIICMCNNRENQKMRSLVTLCFDLKFSKPRVEQIRGAMMSICFKEKISIKGDAIAQIIQGTGQDVRQTLNQLALLSAGTSPDADQVTQQVRSSQKDVKLGPWEVIRKVFSEEEHKTMSFMDHSKLFYYDYSIGPLFVQENYLKVVPHAPKSEHLERFAQAADSISMGDIIDSRVRSTQSWGLLEVQAMFASVIPGHILRGHMGGQIDFPSWLGKNSRKTKFLRMYNELYAHTRMSTTCDRTSLSLDLIRPLRDSITGPLLNKGAEGIPEALESMKAYSLLREDLTNLVELAQWPKIKNPFEQVDPKVKAAFTRAYNKENPALPYAAPTVTVKKKRGAASSEDMYGENEDDVDSEDETEDDVTADSMVKMKKAAATKTTSSKTGSSKAGSSSIPSSSKGKTSSRGRGVKRSK